MIFQGVREGTNQAAILCWAYTRLYPGSLFTTDDVVELLGLRTKEKETSRSGKVLQSEPNNRARTSLDALRKKGLLVYVNGKRGANGFTTWRLADDVTPLMRSPDQEKETRWMRKRLVNALNEIDRLRAENAKLVGATENLNKAFEEAEDAGIVLNAKRVLELFASYAVGKMRDER